MGFAETDTAAATLSHTKVEAASSRFYILALSDRYIPSGRGGRRVVGACTGHG